MVGGGVGQLQSGHVLAGEDFAASVPAYGAPGEEDPRQERLGGPRQLAAGPPLQVHAQQGNNKLEDQRRSAPHLPVRGVLSVRRAGGITEIKMFCLKKKNFQHSGPESFRYVMHCDVPVRNCG